MWHNKFYKLIRDAAHKANMEYGRNMCTQRLYLTFIPTDGKKWGEIQIGTEGMREIPCNMTEDQLFTWIETLARREPLIGETTDAS
jgi:hypothetical protein